MMYLISIMYGLIGCAAFGSGILDGDNNRVLLGFILISNASYSANLYGEINEIKNGN